MLNENFYVFKAPLTFDPSESTSYCNDLRKMLRALPENTEPDPIFDIMNDTLKQWVEEESKQTIKDDDVIYKYEREEIYDGKATSTRPYYYLEWEPEINLEAWYLLMINTANQHGYTVYSDIDERFYFPDGTSFPKDGRKRLEATLRLQQERITQGYETVLKIMQEEADNPPDETRMSKHLKNLHSRVIIFNAILQHCLEKHGIQATFESQKGEKFIITCSREDGTRFALWCDIFTVDPTFHLSEFAYRIIFPLTKHPKTKEAVLSQELWDRVAEFGLMWREHGNLHKQHRKDSLDDETIWREVWPIYIAQNTTNTVTALHHRLAQKIDDFVQNVYQYGSTYDFIDAFYQETHPLHFYFWSSRTSIDDILDIATIILLADYVKHPKLQEMVRKQALRVAKSDPEFLYERRWWLHEYRKYIAKYAPDCQIPDYQNSGD